MNYLPNLLVGSPYSPFYGTAPWMYGYNPYRRPYYPYRPMWNYGHGYHHPYGHQGPGWGGSYGGYHEGQGLWENRSSDLGQQNSCPQCTPEFSSFQTPY